MTISRVIVRFPVKRKRHVTNPNKVWGVRVLRPAESTESTVTNFSQAIRRELKKAGLQ